MNYDLAKKLKDAGFPQKGKGDEIQKGYTVPLSSGIPDAKFIVEEESYNPTLEELIEACGEVIIKLWINGKTKEAAVQLEMQGLDDVIWYKSSEEAVANLYLKLKK